MFFACCIEIQLTDFGDFVLQDSGVAVICYETIIWYTTVFSYSPYVVIQYHWQVTYLSWVLLCFFNLLICLYFRSSSCFLAQLHLLIVPPCRQPWEKMRPAPVRVLHQVTWRCKTSWLINVFSNLVFCIWPGGCWTKINKTTYADSLWPVSHQVSKSDSQELTLVRVSEESQETPEKGKMGRNWVDIDTRDVFWQKDGVLATCYSWHVTDMLYYNYCDLVWYNYIVWFPQVARFSVQSDTF